MNLEDWYETTDGARPTTSGLDPRQADAVSLPAIAILRGGDTFESVSAKPDRRGRTLCVQWLEKCVSFDGERGAFDRDARTLLSNSVPLLRRLLVSKPLHVTVISSGQSAKARDLPKTIRRRATGLFWDRPDWNRARIYLREDKLLEEPAVIAHEIGHAIHYLALSKDEREITYSLLRPTFRVQAAMDEAFAIYTECEFLEATGQSRILEGPGIYGQIRAQWSNDHVFTRFMRKLYFPHKPLAGPKLAGWGR